MLRAHLFLLMISMRKLFLLHLCLRDPRFRYREAARPVYQPGIEVQYQIVYMHRESPAAEYMI